MARFTSFLNTNNSKKETRLWGQHMQDRACSLHGYEFPQQTSRCFVFFTFPEPNGNSLGHQRHNPVNKLLFGDPCSTMTPQIAGLFSCCGPLAAGVKGIPSFWPERNRFKLRRSRIKCERNVFWQKRNRIGSRTCSRSPLKFQQECPNCRFLDNGLCAGRQVQCIYELYPVNIRAVDSCRMKAMEEVVDWEQERRGAKRVLEYLEHDCKQQNVKRRWILRNWPEPSGRRDKKFHISSTECVPELLQRGKKEPSLRSLNAFVGRSLSTLLKNKILRKRTAKKRKSGDALMKLTLDPTATKEGLLRITDGANQSDIHTRAMVVKEGLLRITDGASESDDLVKKKVYHTNQKWLPPKRIFNLKKMDEAEIVTSLPCVLDTLHIHSLQSILTVLTGFATRILNRSWLEERIVQTVNEYVDGCGDTLPDVVTQAMEIMRDERAARKPMSSGNLYELPSSSILAVQSALDQVESLPLRTLHAMYDLMHEKPVQNVRLDESATGGNRARLARALRKGAEILTWDLKDDDPLPEPLTRALRAMSLSAKELDGSDGNLLSIIGPPPPDVEAVHNKLLSALSQLKKLEFHRLTSLSSLVHEGPVQSFCKDHPTYLRSHFRRILLDFLLRCDDPEVPAPIQNIIDAIAAEDTQLSVSPEKSKKYEKKPKKPDRVSKRSMWQQGERNSEEVEAVLQIGSHLEQIVREKEEVERKIVIVPVNVEEDCEQCGVESTVSRNEDEEDLIEDVAVRTAADEAGALCYTILGRALEELLPPKASPLPHYVQKYLKGGFHRVAKQGEAVDRNEKTGDEVDLLMKIAESLPGVSTRALQNMKNRLALI